MPASEAAVQAAVRLEYARRGEMLFRNNSGALMDENGRLVRFGLGNDSTAINKRIKSADLIGWRSFIIPPEWVGHRIAQFCAHEIKPEGWHLTPGDERGQAQSRFLAMVRADGGEADFLSARSLPNGNLQIIKVE